MMLLFTSKHQKRIASLLLIIFSIQFFAPIVTAAAPAPVYHYISQKQKSYYPNLFKTLSGNTALSFAEEKINDNNISLKELAIQQINNDHETGFSEDKVDIGGPDQPEMKSFQSVNGNNMVDLFTGDFSYSVPLLDVGGYPVNLHYSSGINMDQEASWVGLGWNVNPGSITRSMRGLPDDLDGKADSLKKTQRIKENKTTGVTVEPSLEILSSELKVSARLGIFHNNYNGYGLETGVGIGGTGKTAFGSLTGNLSISNNSQEGIRVSPSLTVGIGNEDVKNNLRGSLGISTGYSSRTGISSLQISGGINDQRKEAQKLALPLNGNSYPLATISFATPSYSPSISMPITTTSYSFTGKVGTEHWTLHPSASFTGYYTEQVIADEDTTQTLPAFGYLYSTNGNNREDVLLDFNREKDMEFNYKTTPHIALPQYTYDAFSISGEGTGGSFRPYRGDVGYVFDHSIITRSSSTNGSADVGFGPPAQVHGGLEITNMTTSSTNHRWSKNNSIESKLKFQFADTTYEPVYFRNPGEKTTNAQSYYRSIGDDSLIRIKLSGSGENTIAQSSFIKYDDEGRQHLELPVTENLVKKQRDKRTQVISYFTAEDASILGLDKAIKTISENKIPVGNCADTIIKEMPRVDDIRKKNHLSEISVLNSDGRKYVYGLPIYNVEQKDVTFAVNKEETTSDLEKGLVEYSAGDNTTKNDKGKDNYFSREEMPAYAHNFLLTGIVSPDYVDITGNGISEDDPGDAVKFNYTQVYGKKNDYYQWRTPFQQGRANYNEGLKTYDRDDKGTYLYGKKEIWYLNSIESKTMIAVFKIANDRQDAFAVNNENGGLNNARSTRRLERIDLYVKADLIKNGIGKARPVKSVHFAQSYTLCKGAAELSETGKLTLDSVWFTYNKNNKGKRNPYVFKYNSSNPSFNSKHSDRWGTYKNPADNPAGLSNSDFPYTTNFTNNAQDSTTAANNAAAWNMTDIQLPSGGRMHVTYEADDYAYVQNKRATNMVGIAGINQPSGDKLYNYDTDTKEDYDIIYINTPDVLKNKEDVRNKYLSIDDVLYFKMAVKMPADEFGSGTEMVPGYGTVEDFDVSATNDHQFWVKLTKIDGRSPMSRAALQFLRLNLKSKAYPNSEGVDKLDLGNLIKMMATSFDEFKKMINGFDDEAKAKRKCHEIALANSFVRLSNPYYKKYGGGYRVKKVEIYDSWKKMTDQKESVYGQTYNYTSSEEVNGKKVIISSGVATYEPAIGGEENPFRQPINYSEKVAPMAPVNYMFSEEPIGETFFASPMVGYSKVRVRTINAKARSANGWEESEYFTSKDFPTLVEHTFLEPGSSKFKYETQSSILRLNHKNYVTLSQGFKIELNDMNGKMKAQSTYAETDSLEPIKYSLNFYRTDDDKAPQLHLNNKVWVVDSANGHIDTSGQIGKDIEIMTDLREQNSKAYTSGFSPNVDIIAPFPFIGALYIPSRANFPQKEETRFRSAAVVKIVQRYGILDSVVVMDKGSVVSTKNILYDAETGNVLLSRTNNEFNDPIYNFNYPAYWGYSGMDMAYKNIAAIFQAKIGASGFQLNGGRLFKTGNLEAYPAERFFESGDEVYVYNAVKASPGTDCRYLVNQEGNWKGKLWVIDAAKGIDNDKGLYFIDSLGKVAPDMVIQKMAITRSGKRNMPDVSAGNVVMLNNPLKEMPGGEYRVVIDSNSRVINASTATFKDLWKVENSEYQQDSCYTTQQTLDTVLNATVSRIGRLVQNLKGKKKLEDDKNDAVAKYTVASLDFVDDYGSKGSVTYYNKSLLQFNLQHIPSSAIVNEATVTFSPQRPIGLAPHEARNGHFNYNWNNTNIPFKLNNPQVYLSKIVSGDLSTRHDYFIVSPTNRVSLSNPDWDLCLPASQNCTNLIGDLVANPQQNKGLMMHRADANHPNADYTDYLSFSNSTCQSCSETLMAKSSGESSLLISVPGSCPPQLYIRYTIPKDTCVKVCRKNISDTATNPYRWGILGNWRMERAYTYYNARQENDASIKTTDIRTEGTLKSFMPYWFFSSTKIIPNEDTTRWVWNSAISNFNRKGFEIENFDPLGRYNSGLYGYNQTLPVAVAQNSKYREILSDGFEDYGYKTTYCATCPPKREFDFLNSYVGVDTTTAQSHTGLYSLKIDNGHESLLTVPVDSINNLPSLSAKLDSTAVTTETVIGMGTGLTGVYNMGKKVTLPPFFNKTYCFTSSSASTQTRIDPAVNFDWRSGAAPVSVGSDRCSETYEVKWAGTIQPRFTGPYYFYLDGYGTATLHVNDNIIFSSSSRSRWPTRTVYLEAGKLYPITLNYTKRTSDPAPGYFILSWYSASGQIFEPVAQRFLYPSYPVATPDTAGSVISTIDYYCVKANTVKPFNVIRPVFAPQNKTKLTVSAWVRLDVADCNATPALDSVIQVQFNTGGTAATRWLKKTGLRIEGWQRYESNVDVPADASTMYLRLKTLSANNIYVDDVRVQPFNSGMKGFVYNPVNLRLMAELDENNYASFYEYDDDGTLIRVKKETERGIMTIKETRSALLKE